MEAHAAIDRPRQSIAPRPIDRVMAEQYQQQRREQAQQLADRPGAERQQEESGIERSQDGDRDQEAEQELARGSAILEALVGELRVGPQKATDIGREPEPVDAEREHQQDGAMGQQPPKGAAVAAETDDPARRRNTAGLRRGYGRIENGHARTSWRGPPWSGPPYRIGPQGCEGSGEQIAHTARRGEAHHWDASRILAPA